MKYKTYKRLRSMLKTDRRSLGIVISTIFLYIALVAILFFVVGAPVSRAEGVVYYPEDGEAETVEVFSPIECPLPEELQEYTYYASKIFDVEFELVMAVMYTESGFDVEAISETGDYGLMQINEIAVPELADRLYITDISDPYQNIRAGAYLLGEYVNRYEYVEQALMAYNMGEYGAAAAWDAGAHSTEYTDKVKEKYMEYRRNTP